MIKVNIDIRLAIERLCGDIDPDLIEAIVMTESSGRPDAFRYEPNFYAKYVREGDYPKVQHKELSTSWGLMQVMGLVAWEMGLKKDIALTLCTIEGGLKYGIRHLKRFMDKYEKAGGDGNDAIAAYNAGSARKKDGKYVNQQYVDKVTKRFNELKSEKDNSG